MKVGDDITLVGTVEYIGKLYSACDISIIFDDIRIHHYVNLNDYEYWKSQVDKEFLIKCKVDAIDEDPFGYITFKMIDPERMTFINKNNSTSLFKNIKIKKQKFIVKM